MKILIVAGGIPSKDTPLGGIFAYDQAKALAASGIDVTYFSLDMRSIRRRRHLGFSTGEKDGVRWHIFSFPLGRVPVTIVFYVGRWMIMRLFKRVFKTETPPDIIHAHFVCCGVIASYLSKKTGIPLIITEHSSDMNVSPIPKTLKKYATEAYKQAKKVLSVSSALAKNLSNECGIESEVVPNIIELDTFSQCKPMCHVGYNIVTVSGLIEGKRVINLIKAVEKVIISIPSVHLDVVGDGYLRGDLEKYVKDNGLTEYISFLGYLSREDTVKVYETADCFAMVSERETFGVVYVEAMAAGLPIIATKCGGPEDFIDDEIGVLVEVDNVEETAEAIIQLYKNHDKYNRDEIMRRANNYNAEAIAAKLITIYKQI